MQANTKESGVDPSKLEQAARPFDAEALAHTLRELAADVIQGETTDFLSRWFHSTTADMDLVLWTDSQNRIIKHQLCFFGQVVEWNPIHGTRTGYVFEEEITSDDGVTGEVAETVKFDSEEQQAVIDQAIEIVTFTFALNAIERDKMIYNFRESPKLHKKARERALKVWAPKIDEIVSNVRPTFWRRLRGWVLGD